MNKRERFYSIAAVALSASMGAATAMAADYTTIALEKTVARPVDMVWKKVGSYCAIKDWMKMTCKYSAGAGDVGTIRVLDDKYVELMIGKTAHSYTYALQGQAFYGTLQAVSTGPDSTKLLYTVVYDLEPLGSADAKAKDRQEQTKFFTEALDNMKTLSEGK